LSPTRAVYNALFRDHYLRWKAHDRSFELYVKTVRGRTLVHPYLKIREPAGDLDCTRIEARTGTLHFERARGRLVIRLEQGEAAFPDGARAIFDQRGLEVPRPVAIVRP
jgi:hypothetical protein